VFFYFESVFEVKNINKKLFFLLKFAGAGLACYASWLINYWPFVILEGIWFLVSVYGLMKARDAKAA